MITFDQLQKISRDRSLRWGTQDWLLVDWTNALNGEAGEAANFAKKLRRLDFKLPNKEAGLSITDSFKLREKCANECGDAILYAILTIDFLGFDSTEIVRKVFNQKSIEYGFPERI